MSRLDSPLPYETYPIKINFYLAHGAKFSNLSYKTKRN